MIAWTLVACGDGKSRWAGTITDYGITLNVACLEDIARSKRAADRPQDRQDVLIIEEMLRQREEWFVGLSRRTLRSFVPSAWTSDRV